MKKYLFLIILILVLFVGCASARVSTEKQEVEKTSGSIKEAAESISKKYRVQIIRFGIPEDIAKKYPELADKRVGWGLYNRIIDSFYETGKFEFLEEKEDIMKRVMQQWKLSEMGLVVEEEKIEEIKLSAPEYLVYAEVYDFGISHEENIKGVKSKQENTTVIGVQIRLVNVNNAKYIPASGMGEAKSTAETTWVKAELEFDSTTVGIASQKAIDEAVKKLLIRFSESE